MSFTVGSQVVLPVFGVGHIAGLVAKSFSGAKEEQYYEVTIQQSTVWVLTSTAAGRGMRPVTSKTELARYRRVLRSQPVLLNPDHRQRQIELAGRLKVGLFLDTCEIVRDLNARGWTKPLNETDSSALRKAREGLNREWAIADGVPVGQAAEEVDGLLLASKKAFQA
jgi:RNA polymerase-interacting CarD/CdnL/TRCF family regulator